MDQEDIRTIRSPHTYRRKRHRQMDLGHYDQRLCPELPRCHEPRKGRKGELDEYTSQFQQLAELAGYHELTGMIGRKYFQGLPQGLQESMLAFEPTRHYQTLEDWIEGAIHQHSKYLTYQAYFGGQRKFNPRNPNQQPTKQQWQQGFVKNPNAMDLTPGRTRARAALTNDKRATL